MKHYINGVEVMPANGENIGVRLDFTGDAKEAELNVDSIILTNEAYSAVMSHLNGSLGLFEGIPYNVEIGTLQLDYFIDLTEGAKFSDSQVEVKIKKRRAVDWFISQANATSFELINSKQPITGAFNVPYVIVKDNQLELLVMLSISTYTLTKELYEATKDLVTMVTSPTIEASTPNVGVPPSMNLGAIITAVLKIAAQLVYTTAIALALYQTVSQLIELICPKVRFLNGNKVKDLLTQGCNFLGYKFESNLLDNLSGLTILPVPLVQNNESIFDVLIGNSTTAYNKPYPSASDSVSTLGSLIDEIKKFGNATLKIIGDTVYLERWDFWQNVSSQNFVNTLNLQDKRENEYTYNFNECWKRYYLHYQFDPQDTHTMDKLGGLQSEHSTEPINTVNSDIVLIKGFVDTALNFSLGYRKDKLTFVEKSALVLAQLCDSVVSTLGGSGSLSQNVNARIGVLQISQQYFSKTKLMYIVGNRQSPDYLTKIGAPALYDNYHFINQIDQNLQEIATSEIPFAPKQIEALIENNYIFDETGTQCRILTFDWVNGSQKANIEYSVKSSKGTKTKTIKIL
jgi:hypothetical protein